MFESCDVSEHGDGSHVGDATEAAGEVGLVTMPGVGRQQLLDVMEAYQGLWRLSQPVSQGGHPWPFRTLVYAHSVTHLENRKKASDMDSGQNSALDLEELLFFYFKKTFSILLLHYFCLLQVLRFETGMLSAHLLLVVFARHVRVVEGAVVAGDVADVAVVGAFPVVR